MPDHESTIATYREQEEALVFMGFDHALIVDTLREWLAIPDAGALG